MQKVRDYSPIVPEKAAKWLIPLHRVGSCLKQPEVPMHKSFPILEPPE